MKAFKLSITVLIVVIVTYLWLKPHDNLTPETATVDAEEDSVQPIEKTESLAITSASPVEQLVRDETKVKEIATAEDPWHSRANFEEVEKWKVSRGYYSPEDLAMYKTYSQETIEQLAEGGDIKAIYTLVDLKVAAGATQQEVIDLYMRAAMLGSTQALDWAGLMATTDRNMSKFQGPNGDELYKKEMVDALSIYQVALIRGDREVMERINDARSQVELTPEDLKYIEKRGAEIYTELEKKRKSIGLGPFDNSVPPIVKNYQDEALNDFKRFTDK
jgi:hypothetical protein